VDIAFDLLIRLQRVDSEINRLSASLESIPSQTDVIDRQIQDAAEIVSRAKDKLAANQKKRRDLEIDAKSLKEQIGRFRRQLNDVKTNKEYAALLKEIEEAQQKMDKIEEEIIQDMISADDIEKEIKTANQKKAEEEVRLRQEKEAILKNQRELEEKKALFLKEREELVPKIPPDQLKLFHRISKKMGGVAMSEVTDDFCSICQMRVRPQLLNEIQEMKKIILCEACSRILYSKKPLQGEQPEKKADHPDKIDDSPAS
jgi:predicted  nucleic acid-binding Zn-ribbon protein